MFFNIMARVLLSGVVLLMSVSCGLNMGESQPQAPAPSYSGRGLSCVGEIPQNVENYVNDRMSEQEITTFVTCLEKAFTSFAQLTRGKSDRGTYAPEEIREFLEGYFLKSYHISDKLLAEFMIIKQVMVGGELDRITRDELYQAVDFLEDIRLEAIRLKPHLRYLNPRLVKEQEPTDLGERLGEANEAIKVSIRTLSGRLQKSKKSYPLSHLATFLQEFRQFVKWEDHFQRAIPVAHWVEFLRIFKELTVANSKEEVIRTNEWSPLMKSMARWYLTYLQFQVGVKGQPVLQGVGLQNSLHLASEVFVQVEDALRRQPDGRTITYDQLKQLVVALRALNWLPEGIRVESLEQASRAVISRVFGDPELPPSQRKASGLTLDSLSLMRHEFYRWASVQMNLDSQFKGTGVVRVEVPNLQSHVEIPMDAAVNGQSQQDAVWEEFLKVRKIVPPLYENGKYRVTLVPEAERLRLGIRHDFHNLSMMNLMRTIATLIFRGYSEDHSLIRGWDAGIRSREMQQFYEDFREIAIDLKWADVRNRRTGERIFIEGNLFNYSSDGFIDGELGSRGQMNMAETMEFFAYLISGGQMGNDLYLALQQQCASGPIDIQCRPMIERSCVREYLHDVILKNSDHMPGLKLYLQRAPLLVRKELAKNLLDTALTAHSSEMWVEHSELATVAVIAQYAEAVMTRFDANRDGVLVNKEVYASIPVFQGYIKKFAREKMGLNLYDWMAKGAFLAILTDKKIPDWKRLVLDVRFDFWALQEPIDFNQPIWLDRLELSKVFRAILGKLSEGQSIDASKHQSTCVPPKN